MALWIHRERERKKGVGREREKEEFDLNLNSYWCVVSAIELENLSFSSKIFTNPKWCDFNECVYVWLWLLKRYDMCEKYTRIYIGCARIFDFN